MRPRRGVAQLRSQARVVEWDDRKPTLVAEERHREALSPMKPSSEHGVRARIAQGISLGILQKTLGTALALLALSAASLYGADVAPNVVIILADDLGWGDVASLNPQSAMTTPRIDSIASEGMRFTDAHSPSSVCTPTRYGLLTGRYAWRTRLTRRVLGPYSRPLIEPERPTLGTLLQSHGYRTGVVGKWHLGLGIPRLPEEDATELNGGIDFAFGEITGGPVALGFHEFFGLVSNFGWPPYVYIRDDRFTAVPFAVQRAVPLRRIVGGPIALDYDFEQVLDRLTEEAVAFIERSAAADAPFFLYFPLPAPHRPLLPEGRFRATTGLGVYGDFVAQVDWTVGQVLDALARSGARDNTLVVFASDNGSIMGTVSDFAPTDHTQSIYVRKYRESTHRSKGPWSGSKGSIREGGHRVPLFVRWPGVVAAGSENTETVSFTDFYATLADLLGEGPRPGVAPDSQSLLPMLRDEPAELAVPAVHHSQNGMFAIRDGHWKLVFGDGRGGSSKEGGEPFRKPWQLYDLRTDPTETTNLVEEYPQVVARLEASLEAIRSYADQDQPVSDDANLSGLAMSGVDLGTFDPAVTTYTAVVDNAAEITAVTATPRHATATVVVADFAGETDGITRIVSLAEGTNPVTVTVTAPGGTATRTYTVWVNRGLQDGAVPRLSATDFAVTVSPEAIAEGESATMKVAISTGVTSAEDQTIALALSGTAAAEDYTGLPATLTLAAGASSATAELAATHDQEEEELETVTVTASHGGVLISSATVTITSVSHAATLSALSLSGIDIGTFSGGVTAYAASVAHDTSSTRVTATASHAEASVSIDPGAEVSLAEGTNEIVVTVTAEDGETTQTYTATVTRAGPPLTASFASLPEAHTGSGTVVLRVQFSEAVSTSYRTLRDQSFQVTDGSVRNARRVDGRSDLWEIEIAPSSEADMVVVLPATTDCAAAGAVCTESGKPLSTRLAATIPWGAEFEIPVVSVETEQSRVSEGETAEFRVTRTGPTTGRLTVGAHSTRSDKTEATSLLLPFQAGVSSKTPTFIKSDDKVVRGDLTFTITLEDGEGYTVSEEGRSAEVVVEENDVPDFTVSVEPTEIAEGESATVRVEIANGVTFGEDQVIALDFAGSTATKGADYTVSPEPLTLRGLPAGGPSSVTATLAAAADSDEEGGETVTVTALRGGEPIGAAAVTITDVAPVPLTAAFAGMPERHDGETAFTFELRFSEEIAISYVTLRDTAFEVTGGVVRKARRLTPPSNLSWEITVKPATEGDLVLVLEANRACDTTGAVCTGAGRRLSNRLQHTVRGPD